MVRKAKISLPPASPERSAERYDIVQLYRNKAFPFVRRGAVYGFALKEDLVKPAIPAGESAIFGLLALESNITYGLTGGRRGHVFYFHSAFGVTHVAVIGEGPVTGGALVNIGGDEIAGGWWGQKRGGLFRHHTAAETGQGLEQFLGEVTPVEPVPFPLKGEGVAALVYDSNERTVYGLTLPGRRLFAWQTATNAVRGLARVEGAAPILVFLPDGNIMGAAAEGRLWKFSPAEEQVTLLDAHAPCQMGKRYAAGVDSLLGGSDGLVYGGTSTDGYLFTYNPGTGKAVNLGKPNRQSNIRTLCEGHDGLIYGIVEEARGMAHLFCFDPAERGFTDVGIIGTAFPEYWVAHSIGSMSVGPFGEIFMGETDNISHLFIYYPPIPGGQRKTHFA